MGIQFKKCAHFSMETIINLCNPGEVEEQSQNQQTTV